MGRYNQVTLQTKQNLIDAFWVLYCEKKIANITVKDIATKAGYNRSTFYQYFRDVYDVLEHLELSLIPTIELLPPVDTPLGKLGMSMDLYMKLYEQNAKYYSILLGEKGDPAFASKLKKAIHSMLVSELAIHKSMDTNKLDFILEYTLTSMIGLMSYWFSKNGPMPKEQLYDLIRQLMEEGVVKQFQQNMEENASRIFCNCSQNQQ